MEAVFSADPVIQRMKEVIEEDHLQILQTDLRPMNDLLLDVNTVLIKDQQEAFPENFKIWRQLLHNCLADAKSILHRYNPPQRQRRFDCLMCKPGRLSKEVKEWKVLFDYIFQTFEREFSLFVSAPHQYIVYGDPIPATSPEGSVQRLSKDEAWMLFNRIAFNNSPVSQDIEEPARKIADECRGLPLPITLVAAAMIGKSSVDEWKSCLSSIKINEDPSIPDTHPPLVDKHLYQQLRWCYDALPNANVKNCFLYCAMYQRGARIRVEELVQTWIAEGLVKSKEGSHLMDMAIGRTYINLLIHRCFFENDAPYYQNTKNVWTLQERQIIRVADVIRDVAIFIGEKEEKCVFKAGQELQNFPETENEECKRISVRGSNIENLPSEFRCPKLVSLFLGDNRIKDVPSEFLVSLTSLKVLHLSSNSQITSIPSSIGQLKQLEFLNLSGLDIEHLPKEIGQLSSLQFLDISNCMKLRSLPSEIGGLTNLKCLDLSSDEEWKSWVIPDEFSQLTSLNKLDMNKSRVSEASIWKMKDLRNLTMLSTWEISSPIKVGIMGNWLEMRHLCLFFDVPGYFHELPDDMQKMSKLQSFIMRCQDGLSVPNNIFKFQHLEYIQLYNFMHLKELSPLERLPNLKYLKLDNCYDLKELGIGNPGRASGFLKLEKLFLYGLIHLESIGGTCNNGVWNERTLPRLRIVMIESCPQLKRLPVGMDKLLSLRNIIGKEKWWQTLIWEDESMKMHLQNLFTASDW